MSSVQISMAGLQTSEKSASAKDPVTPEVNLNGVSKVGDGKTSSKVRPPYFGMFVAEFIGTGLLMFLGCMGCVGAVDNPPASHHWGGLAFGLTVLTIIQLFGHISGAHLNPAVTIATVLHGNLTIIMAAIYIIAQFSGAILGFGLLKLLLPTEYTPDGFCATMVNPKINTLQGLVIEIVITCVLVFTCCSIWDKRNADKPDSVGIRFGFVITVLSNVAGPFTGASMNTVRSVAPLVFGGMWDDHWIYWIGPNLAPFISCGLYKILYAVRENESTEDKLSKEKMYIEDASEHATDKV